MSQLSSTSCARTTEAASASEKRRSIASRGSPSRSVVPKRQAALRVWQVFGMVLEPIAPRRVFKEEPRQPELRQRFAHRNHGSEAERARRGRAARCQMRRAVVRRRPDVLQPDRLGDQPPPERPDR